MLKLVRHLLIFLLCVSATVSYAATNAAAELERAEQLSWADPDKAVLRLDELEAATKNTADLVQLLTLRGMASADARRDSEVQKTIARLESLRANEASAELAVHLVRGYWLCQSDEFQRAAVELKSIDANSAHTPLEQYHLESLRAAVLHLAGQQEAALVANEKAWDIAQAMHSTPRALRVSLKMVQLFIRTGSLDRASAQLVDARQLAEQTDDEASLVVIASHEADIADRRGDRAAERRGSLEALGHAKRVGSDQLLAYALCNLGDSYAKSGEYGASLGYSKQALALGRHLRRNGFEHTVRFNIGIAEIGLGQLADGKRDIESTIKEELTAGNLVDAEISMAEYAEALERAHDWRGAVDVHHRHEEIRDKLMTQARQQALLELSAKFDTERNAREIELLKRDNAIKDRDLKAQRMRQQMIVVIALLTGTICVALVWAFYRIRKINRRLRYNSEHDTLTGLYNRRYFAEHVLCNRAGLAFSGCVVLIDVDHFKRVNDALGHSAGDVVLQAIAKRLANALRERDTLVRWGGEEFLILLDPMSELQLNGTVQRLLNAIRNQPVKWHGEEIRCTASIGYARFPIAGTAVDVPIERAISLVDKALYHAKRSGRDRACLITQVSAHSERELSSINAEFEAAAVDRRVRLAETTSEAA